jgi:hypothetical protein
MNVSTVTSSSSLRAGLQHAQSADLGVDLVHVSKEVSMPTLGPKCGQAFMTLQPAATGSLHGSPKGMTVVCLDMAHRSIWEVLAGFRTRLDTPPAIKHRQPDSRLAPDALTELPLERLYFGILAGLAPALPSGLAKASLPISKGRWRRRNRTPLPTFDAAGSSRSSSCRASLTGQSFGRPPEVLHCRLYRGLFCSLWQSVVFSPLFRV